MAISLKAPGTWAEYTTDGTVAIPGTPSAGNRMFLFVTWRNYAVTLGDPSGWTPIGTVFADGTTPAGGGTGSVNVMAWYRDWQSGDSNPTLDFSGAVIAGAVIMLWEKGSEETWGTPLTATAAWAASASATISASSTVAVPNDSVVMGLLGFRDNLATITRGATTGIDVASGITWNGNYVESPAAHFDTTTGSNASGDLGHRFVTTGGTVTLRMTAELDTSESGSGKWVVQGVTTTPTASSKYNVISGESAGAYFKTIGAP